ncbi:MAG: FG-GAP repeat protein [Candidatus Binatia bacterium]
MRLSLLSPRRAPTRSRRRPTIGRRIDQASRLSATLFATLLLSPLGPTPASAQPVRTLDLLTTSPTDGELRRVHGSVGNGSFGVPVAGTLDCDGDGARDYAMASMLADPLGRENAGEIYLVFGDGTTGGTLDTASPQASILRIYGAGTRETAGSELWMDDVTGDGLGDLLIARQNFRPDGPRPGAGALTIVVGGPELRTLAASLTPLDLSAPDPSVTLTTFVGAEAIDRLGIWMRTGDVTGDGIADIVVGADQEDSPGESDNGAAYVIRGGAALATAGTIDLADFGSTALAGHIAKIEPPAGSQEYHMGATCQIADLDGNLRAEVLVAAALNRAGASIRAEDAPSGSAHGAGGALDGEVYIAWDDNFTGNPWPAGYTFAIDSAPGTMTTIRGGSLNISFGEELLGGLDYDADALADLFVGDIIGDWSASRAQSGSGHILYDAAGLAGLDFDLDAPPPGVSMTTFLGGGTGDIAADTALHGDFDGDGIDDLAFSSPHGDPIGRPNAGTVHVFLGRPGGFPALIDLAPGALPSPAAVEIVQIYGAFGDDGTDAGDTLAYSAAAGDVDADGRVDLIINEMLGNGTTPGAEDTGNMIIISGDLIAGNDDSPGCPPQPLADCFISTAKKSRVRVTDRSTDSRDRFLWRWKNGEATTLADIGEAPSAGSTGYRVCVYDDSESSQPLTDAALPAGGTCGAKPCWKAAGGGYRFKDSSGRHSGIRRACLRSGTAGRSRTWIKANGSAFTSPGPPAHLPLTLQLVVTDTTGTRCWQTVFSEAGKNEPGRLRARGP